jgi:hypothetical protein
MADKNTPVSAFPNKRLRQPREDGTGLYAFESGMTLRDYFIAHAPAEPQEWFKPVLSEKPIIGQLFVSDDGERFYKSYRHAEENEGDCFRDVNRASFDAWCKEEIKQKYVQWPAAWADEMLKAREA